MTETKAAEPAAADAIIDLTEVEDDDLIEELEMRGYTVTLSEDDSGWELEEAQARLQRGDVGESLVYIARHLGPQFDCLLDLIWRRFRDGQSLSRL